MTRLFQEILDKKETRKCVRRNYLPFLKYLESCEPGLANYTSFLAKLDKRLFRIFHALQESGLERILTLCHGDSKPDNFMFRKIEIDIEDMECEGLEGILIDWQGGFIGYILPNKIPFNILQNIFFQDPCPMI